MKRKWMPIFFGLSVMILVMGSAFASPPIDNGLRSFFRKEGPDKLNYNYREVKWEALVPKGWNPMQGFNNSIMGLNDNDPRAMAALKKMRKAWDSAPTEPSLNGERIRIAGFVVPLESDQGQLQEFLLVPYFGACIHTPPPPANQIIHVINPAVNKSLKRVGIMEVVWVSGRLEVKRSRVVENAMEIAGSVGYQMTAEFVEPYKGRH